MMERVSKALRKTFELKLLCDCQTVSNEIQIDYLYSVLEIVWTLTVKEEFIEMEKSVDHTNNKWLTIVKP